MGPRPLEQIRSRRRAAIHEAGHVMIARLFGYTLASAWLIRDDDAYWTGRVQLRNMIPINAAQSRMIGVAGAVAEACWDDRFWDVESVDWEARKPCRTRIGP